MSIEHTSNCDWTPFPREIGKDGVLIQSRGFRRNIGEKEITVFLGTRTVEVSTNVNGITKILETGGLPLLDSYMSERDSLLVKLLAKREEKSPTEPPWF